MTVPVTTSIVSSTHPVEYPDEEAVCRFQDTERRWVKRFCLASPLLAVMVWGLAARWLLTVLYLKPLATDANFIDSLQWKPAIFLGLLALIMPWCWWLSTQMPAPFRRGPWAAAIALGCVIAINVLLPHPRVTWFFVEWALVRTPNPSFARNTLMWEQRNFEQAGKPDAPLTRLVGSSQIYQGTDISLLAQAEPSIRWEKNCLAGFGPMQYVWLEERLLSPRPQQIICWLSEFDFFREDNLPTNRLQWASSFTDLQRLQQCIDEPVFLGTQRVQPILAGQNWSTEVRDQWSLRGDFADLALAAALPVWRLREHIRRVVFHYWEDHQRPLPTVSSDEPQLALSADMDLAQQSLRQNVGRKRFVETNFRAFAQFAQDLAQNNVRLLVCEGTTHPGASAVYDPAYRQETRQRLQQMSAELGFDYLSEEKLPQFAAADFADPYHLNESGRERFSRFLADTLKHDRHPKE